MNSLHFSYKVAVYHDRKAREELTVAGYAAIKEALTLPVTPPNKSHQ